MPSLISLTNLDGDLTIVNKNKIISCEVQKEDVYEGEWVSVGEEPIGTKSYTVIKLDGQADLIYVKESVKEVMDKIQT